MKTINPSPKIIKQLSEIQKEVKKSNQENELELLQNMFGGELFYNNNLLKINRFCTIEYINNKFKLTTKVYDVEKEILGNKNEIINLLQKYL